jgi:hypothetical protein
MNVVTSFIKENIKENKDYAYAAIPVFVTKSFIL